MRKVNYRSDFDFILRLLDCRGDDIGFPDYDWEALLYTRGNRANGHVASCKGGVCMNCFNDGGRVHVVVNSPRLGLGELFVDFKAALPNSIYPDEHQDEMAPLSTGIELVREATPCPCSAEVELMLPYVRFRYEDFTPEQIEELKRPATEAAQRADLFVQTASEAEAIRMANEESRVREESARLSQEHSRESAEEVRRAAEAKRVVAEEARELAETKRATEFATWETEIDGKADRTELSNIIGLPTEGAIEALEPTLITEALRKVPQALTPQEQAQVKANLAISKMELFCDLFNAAAGNAGYARITNGEFDCKLNKLTLTYEEAQDIYAKGVAHLQYAVGKFSDYKGRTVLPLKRGINPQASYLFNNAKFLEIVNVDLMSIDTGVFKGCTNLREIIGTLQINKNVTNAFEGCTNLTDIQDLRITANNANLQDSPLLSLTTLQVMVQKSSDSTVTVHPGVYSKLTDETNTEWNKVLTDAAARNITFATV